MMTFSYVSAKDLTNEQFDYLKGINEYIYSFPSDELFQLYVVKDDEDIKSVFAINYSLPYTDVEINWATKEKERNKGYFEFGFYMIMEIIKQNPSIEVAFINVAHLASLKLCKKYHLSSYNNRSFYFNNPNFNVKYNELFDLIENGATLEELAEYCGDDEVMFKIMNEWYKQYESDIGKIKGLKR